MSFASEAPTTRAGLAAHRPATRSRPIVGRWHVLQKIGAGGFCDVFAAQSADGPRPQPQPADYAIKILRPQWDAIPAAIDLMRNEAGACQSVTHPHVIPVLDAGVRGAPYYVVMPRLRGRTLQQRIAAQGRLPLPIALWVARQAAQGLKGLSAAGWRHGDIKPANLFLAANGHCTLLDLGYAQRDGLGACAADRPLLGTLNYMAPEMLTSTTASDIRSDIYSLGIVLYEMLVGRLPYEGRNPAEVAELQRSGIPDRLRCLDPTLPGSVVALVRQMIAKQPLRRPQTPDDLVEQLVAEEIRHFDARFAPA